MCTPRGEEGLYHRSMRPVEPEAVFGQIKYDGCFRRFHYRRNKMVGAEFATVAIAHNIKKMMISVVEAPKEASSLAVESHPTTKKATNNHLLDRLLV